MPRWRIGTIGFVEPDWVGPFYPRGIRSGEHLAYYARYFDTIELDTTFHAVPTVDRVRQWASQVPPGFRFGVKAPKAITHDNPIAEAAPGMLSFCEVVRHFGDRLGAVLIQFPPHVTSAAARQIDDLLRALPADLRYAVEFRHSSWNNDRTADLLSAYQCCWAMADLMNDPWVVPVTTDFTYVRFIGVHEQYAEYHREQVDVTDRLRWWRSEFEHLAPPPVTTYAVFGNDYSGYAVGSANRFRRVLGLPVHSPSPGDKGELFG